jgi:hypothetical protein
MISVSHTWTQQGNYNIRAKAKDDPNGDGDLSDGEESQWSESLPISMPKSKYFVFSSWFRILNILIDKILFYKNQFEAQTYKTQNNFQIASSYTDSGTTATYEEECKIKVEVKICICGGWVDDANQSEIDALHGRIKADFEKRFNDANGAEDGEPPWRVQCALWCDPLDPGCEVNFKVTVSYLKNHSANRTVPGWHVINIHNNSSSPSTVTGQDTNGDGTTDDLPDPDDGTSTNGSWNANAAPGVYAHEIGHLMGLFDKYVESTINIQHPDGSYTTNRSTYPIPGEEGNIMAETSGYPDQDDIDNIIDNSSAICPCKCCPEEEDDTPPDCAIDEPVNETIIDPVNPVTVQGHASDVGLGLVQINFTLEWDGGEYEGSPIIIDPPESYIGFSWGPFVPEDFVDPDDTWIKIIVEAVDGAGNTGSDSIILYIEDEPEDTTPPVTEKIVGEPNEEDGFIIWPYTPLTFIATDDMSGVNHINYEIWWDTDGDMVVDTMIFTEKVYEESFIITTDMFGILSGLIELQYFAVDNAGNVEETHYQEHMVMEY